MRLVVTGNEGQVVRSLVERACTTAFEIVPLGRPELDLAAPASDIEAAVIRARPDVLVSAAAYTKVDQAETDEELAFLVNERGPRALASAARSVGCPIFHLSTDYVFDGRKSSPYVETDETGPTGVYGASKLAGERAVLEETDNSVVLRTAWVYSPFGANFIKTMLRLASERNEVAIVADQRGNPTSALDIADGILRIATNLRKGAREEQRGIFHMTGAGDASWADFAEAIFAASAEAGGPVARVKPIRTEDYPTAARRPANSRLDSGKLARIHGVSLPDWHVSMKEVVSRLLQSGQEN